MILIMLPLGVYKDYYPNTISHIETLNFFVSFPTFVIVFILATAFWNLQNISGEEYSISKK